MHHVQGRKGVTIGEILWHATAAAKLEWALNGLRVRRLLWPHTGDTRRQWIFDWRQLDASVFLDMAQLGWCWRSRFCWRLLMSRKDG